MLRKNAVPILSTEFMVHSLSHCPHIVNPRIILITRKAQMLSTLFIKCVPIHTTSPPLNPPRRLCTLFIKYVRAAVGGDDVEKDSAVLGHWKITFKFLTPSVRGTMHSPTRLYRELRAKHHTGNYSYRPYYITPIPLRHPQFVSIRVIRGQPSCAAGPQYSLCSLCSPRPKTSPSAHFL